MDFSFRNLSNEERLFLAVPPSKPSVASYSVEGGRTDTSSGGPFLINGQQLMMQLDCLTSAMMDMDVSVWRRWRWEKNMVNMLSNKVYFRMKLYNMEQSNNPLEEMFSISG